MQFVWAIIEKDLRVSRCAWDKRFIRHGNFDFHKKACNVRGLANSYKFILVFTGLIKCSLVIFIQLTPRDFNGPRDVLHSATAKPSRSEIESNDLLVFGRQNTREVKSSKRQFD